MLLNEASIRTYETSKRRGKLKGATEHSLLLDVITEVMEAYSATKKADYNMFDKLEKNIGFKEAFKFVLKDTFEDEIADSILILLSLCEHKNIDIVKQIQLKLKYNDMR